MELRTDYTFILKNVKRDRNYLSRINFSSSNLHVNLKNLIHTNAFQSYIDPVLKIGYEEYSRNSILVITLLSLRT